MRSAEKAEAADSPGTRTLTSSVSRTSSDVPAGSRTSAVRPEGAEDVVRAGDQEAPQEGISGLGDP